MNALDNEQKGATAHTPGPWQIDDAGPGSGNVIRIEIFGADRNHSMICEIEDSAIEVPRDARKRKAAEARDLANAKLIAASPDLLAALKDALLWIDGPRSECIAETQTDLTRAMSAAISKATA